jgi:5-methyltetrahydropteroyltriglutamate--homocysteine methyltransferase
MLIADSQHDGAIQQEEVMQLSSDRILTTHVGSLPRPDDLRAMLEARERGVEMDAAEFEAKCHDAVNSVVAKQRECGTDVISDGEMSKISYVGYVKERLAGIEDVAASASPGAISSVLPTAIVFPDIAAHPDYAAHRAKQSISAAGAPACTGPLSYGDTAPLLADIARAKAAAEASGATEVFMNSASPGVLAMFIPTRHHRNEDAYIADLADAMKREYEIIHQAGFILQIDCPDLAMSWHTRHWEMSDKEFLAIVERNMEAISHATADIPPEAMRIHICWGNYAGPHTHDYPVAKLFGVLCKARAQAISFEGANPRHDHEWEDWKAAKLPNDKVLVPGVLDSTTNTVEHPRLVAQRIKRYADIVGRERVIAGSDCGFGTFALRQHQVFPSIVWSKLRALTEGAAMASKELWKRE